MNPPLPTTEPITTKIQNAIDSIPGWSPPDQLLSLFMLALASADIPGDILELGSWCGRSAVVLGMAAQLSGKGKVHCVDLFPEKDDWYRNADGTYSFATTIGGTTYAAYQHQTVWAEPFENEISQVYRNHPGTLAAFRIAVHERNLDDWVIPFKGNLPGFSQQAPENLALRMAFIDGDHGYDTVCCDIETIERFLLPGGWICFDDAFSSYTGVDQAIREKIIDSGAYEVGQQISRKLFVARRKRGETAPGKKP